MNRNSQTPWAYRKEKSESKLRLLYRVPVGLKVLFLLSLSLAFFFFDYFFLPIATLILIGLAINAGILPWDLLRGGKPLFILCLGLIIYKAIDFPPLKISFTGTKEGVFLSLRMCLSFSAGALLFSTTTMGEIYKSLTRLETFLHIKKKGLGLGISLMLGFLPRFFEIWEDTDLAWRSRAGKKGITKLIALIPLIIERMMEKAAQTAEALESRGF